jgi:hypothetical protein
MFRGDSAWKASLIGKDVVMRRWKRLAASLLLVLPATATTPIFPASAADTDRLLPENDWEAGIVATPDSVQIDRTAGVLDGDPLGLVPKLPFVQRYSLDTDHWEVWLCGSTGYSMGQAIADLEAATVDYFDAMSGGRYAITYSPGGTSTNPNCISDLESGDIPTIGNPEGVIVIDSVTGGGYASPGLVCSGSDVDCPGIDDKFPLSGRYAVVGAYALSGFGSVAAHEIGHTIQWPHSNSGRGDDYDNPIDLMSGNLTTGGYTEPLPYGTAAFNRYQAGWIEPGDVVIAGGASQQISLQPFSAPGTQMLVVPTTQQGVFYSLGARTSSTYDPIPTQWEGVEVYKIDHDCDTGGFNGLCPGIFRDQYQEPPSPNGVGHVLQVGESIALETTLVNVVGRDGDGFVVDLIDLPFRDIGTRQFVKDIMWLSDAEITKGCNPPTNSRFCPTDTVTRGEMAAFLVRALGLTDDGGGNDFVDDDGSVFEGDIAKLAAAGITKGCNPPANDMYCPTNGVTREQMAAFLVRAYHLTDDGGGNTFVDDDNSAFETDIARLATAGITRGCNPPANTMFCPNQSVTREQMAAFLHRASTG